MGAVHPTHGESRFGMEKIKSTVLIYKRGSSYFADVHGTFGGGFLGCHAGDTVEDVALFAIRMKAEYVSTNLFGGDVFVPAEVREAMTATTIV